MRIEYLISTMVFWWRENNLSFEQECEFIKSLGYGIEIWPTIRGHNECRFEKRNWLRLREATKSMIVVLHGRNDGPTVAEWTEQIKCAQMLGATIVCQMESLCVSDTLDVADWDFASEVINIAESHSVGLSIETGKLQTVRLLLNKYPYLNCCYNTSHVHLSKESSYKEYIDSLLPRIHHLHLNDTYGQFDDHQPPGLEGGIENEHWQYLLERLQTTDNRILATLEMHPSMPAVLINKAQNYLFGKMDWPQIPKPIPNYHEKHYRPL